MFAKNSRLVFLPTSPLIWGMSMREATEEVESFRSKDCFLTSSADSFDSEDSPSD